MSRFNPSKDEQIEVLTMERDKYRGLLDVAQGMIDIDEVHRLRKLCCKYVEQIRQLEKMKGIKWTPIPTNTPIM